MPMNYEMPRWVGQPADPAAHYATGMQIGMRLGAEQAANQYRQQQLLMEQQKMAFEQQYAQQKQALEIGDLVQKQRAAAAYQGMVSQGVNPMQALAVTGLSMGMDPDRLASIQANQEYRQAQLAATQEDRAARRAFAQQREGRIKSEQDQKIGLLERRISDYEQFQRERGGLADKREERMTAKDRALAMAKINKELDESGLISDAKVARRALDDIEKQRWWSTANKETAKAKAQAHLTETESALSKLRNELMDQYGIELPTKPARSETQTPAPVLTQPATPLRVGDDTMPDVSPKRVRVRSPNGRTGTIPESQREEALKSGYTEL